MTIGAAAPGSLAISTRQAPVEAALCIAVFFGVGGVLGLFSHLVPAWEGRNEAITLPVAAVATATAPVLYLARRSLTVRVCHALGVFGSLLIAALMYAGGGGGASATYEGLFIWVVVYSALFFSPRGASLQVLVALLAEVIALAAVGEAALIPVQAGLSAGVMITTGLAVGLLAARLRTLTMTDELTGLANRRLLDLVLHDRLGSDRSRPPVAVLGIDLDGFKKLNDSYGHAAGDELLKEVAARWVAALRRGDILARTGGDEFLVVLTDCDEERARRVAARIIAVIPPPVSACVGLVVVPGAKGEGPVGISQVLADVDAALYEGKAQGPGSIVVVPGRALSAS